MLAVVRFMTNTSIFGHTLIGLTKMQKIEHNQDKVPSAKHNNDMLVLKLHTIIKKQTELIEMRFRNGI